MADKINNKLNSDEVHFCRQWWRNIAKCGRLSQSSWLSVVHYNIIILTYLLVVHLIQYEQISGSRWGCQVVR